jgi:nitroreductase
MSFLANLKWRRAVKSFAPAPTVQEQPDIFPILEAAINAPSAFGLQPFKILVITDPVMKRNLAPVCFNQPQITTCSHLLVFCARTDLETRLEEFVRSTGIGPEYKGMIESTLESLSHPVHWAKHQVYLALGFALAAAAEKKIATCPMEGFSADGVSSVLNLPTTLQPAVLLAVGNEDPSASLTPRFRFPIGDLVLRVTGEGIPTVPRTRMRHATPVRRRPQAQQPEQQSED